MFIVSLFLQEYQDMFLLNQEDLHSVKNSFFIYLFSYMSNIFYIYIILHSIHFWRTYLVLHLYLQKSEFYS